jgi:hypothetical protein
MTDAPETIWAWNFIASKQNEFMTGGWNDKIELETSGKETEYTRTDISKKGIRDTDNLLKDIVELARNVEGRDARIAELEAQAIGFRESIRKAALDSEHGHEILDICWDSYFPEMPVNGVHSKEEALKVIKNATDKGCGYGLYSEDIA